MKKNGNVKKVVLSTLNGVTDVAITATSATVGSLAYVYCNDHDICNDPVASQVTGIVTMSATAMLTRGILLTGKNVIVNTTTKVVNKIKK